MMIPYLCPELPAAQKDALRYLVKTPLVYTSVAIRNWRAPGLDEREQHRVGRAELMSTSFEIFERNVRDQLARTLAPGGFDPAADIIAITVNRWPHGYAYEYNPLFDPDWNEREQPHVIGRAPLGRITIANSDSGAGAYTDSAIEQAHRAIEEVIALET
jgi:spermidine dehydrogenase